MSKLDLLHDDKAENSIMQTITIAVSAILIAAGLVTAPGLINNARDSNARTNLANIAYAQEYEFADSGRYLPTISALNSGEGIKLTVDAQSRVGMLTNDSGKENCYTAFSESTSGRVFFRSCDSTVVREVPSAWPTTAPAGFPASITWPTTKNKVLGNIAPQLSEWKLYNGATFDESTGAITLPNNTSTAYSALIPVNNIKSFQIALDGMIPSTLADPNRNAVTVGISYFGADGVTPVYNTGGAGQGPWVSNGDFKKIDTINKWQRVTSGLGTGNTSPTAQIKYVQLNFWVSTTYSQPGISFRNPTFTVGY
jgi:type II secretory pathway pseudopilin PulG